MEAQPGVHGPEDPYVDPGVLQGLPPAAVNVVTQELQNASAEIERLRALLAQQGGQPESVNPPAYTYTPEGS